MIREKGHERTSSELTSSIYFTANYRDFENLGQIILLVEGETDVEFMKRVKTQTVVVKNAARDDSPFRNGVRERNSKDAVKKAIIACLMKAQIQESTVYGLVDRDYGQDVGGYNGRLFVTDTHDLETLLISTDETVVQRTSGATDKEVNSALYIAYQMGCIKDITANTDLFRIITGLTPEDGVIAFALFLEGDRINTEKMIEHVLGQGEKRKIKKIKQSLQKVLKKKLDENGVWKQPMPDREPEFWQILNGHDILAAIRSLNPGIDQKYREGRSGRRGLDRMFESGIIKEYDIRKLKTTVLYQKMREKGIMKDIS